jgi:hypothetical protein
MIATERVRMQTNTDDFQRLLVACDEVSHEYPEGVVYIGGIAVYLHAINNPRTEQYAESTHDADFYISLSDMGDLRDAEEVVPNRRLSKHQMMRDGFEFDIYTERQSGLIVSYDAVMASAKKYDAFRVAGLEHLLVLKLEAYRDRRQSTKGQKDAKDIFRIAMLAAEGETPFDWALADPYLTDEHFRLLEEVWRGTAAVNLARGNAKLAKALRATVGRLVAHNDTVKGRSR